MALYFGISMIMYLYFTFKEITKADNRTIIFIGTSMSPSQNMHSRAI